MSPNGFGARISLSGLRDRAQQFACPEPEDLDAYAEQQKSRYPHDDAGTGGAEQPRQAVGVAIAEIGGDRDQGDRERRDGRGGETLRQAAGRVGGQDDGH